MKRNGSDTQTFKQLRTSIATLTFRPNKNRQRRLPGYFGGEQEEEPEMSAEEIEQEIKRLKQLLAKKKK